MGERKINAVKLYGFMTHKKSLKYNGFRAQKLAA
jgi:hypothetical protein